LPIACAYQRRVWPADVSYVLEALKKAEAQKNPGARTALVEERREYRRNRWWQILVATALLANLAVVLWLFYPRTETGGRPAEQVPTPQSLPADPTAPGPAAAIPGSVMDKHVQNPAATVGSDVPAPVQSLASGSGATRPLDPPVRLALSDLPTSARNRFPGLAFSTHIYAEDPALRALVVNGNRLTEGDRFGVLELVEVTEEGAVFGFENYLVNVSVLDTWD
jgi:hypothetical protein